MKKKDNKKLCPRCKMNELDMVEVRNCLSRMDNKTYICNICGSDEAIFNLKLNRLRKEGENVKAIELEKEEVSWLK